MLPRYVSQNLKT